jgi:hypothetical protein
VNGCRFGQALDPGNTSTELTIDITDKNDF